MELLRLVVRDLGPFTERAFDLAGPLVGVVGENGAGKSTLARAIYYALTGDASRLGRTEGVREGAGAEGRPGADLVFDPGDGSPATLSRSFARGSRPSFRRLTHGGQTWMADIEVAAQVARWTGLSAAALGDAVFVDQGRLTAILDDPPAQRAAALQTLFGLDEAQKARAFLETALSQWPAPPDPALVAAVRSRLARAHSERDAARAARDAARALPTADPADAALVAAFERGTALAAALARAEEALTAALTVGADAEVQAAGIGWGPADARDYAAIVRRTAEARRLYREAASAAAAAEARRTAAAEALYRAGDACRGLTDAAVPPAPPAEMIRLRDSRGPLTVLAAASPGHPCPTCQQALPDGLLGAAAADLGRLELLEADYAQTWAAYAAVQEQAVAIVDAYRVARENYRQADAASKAAAAAAAAAWAGEDAYPSMSDEEFACLSTHALEREALLDRLTVIARDAAAAAAQARGERDRLLQESGPAVAAEAAAAARDRLTAARSAEVRLAAATSTAAALEGAVVADEALLERLTACDADAERRRGEKQVLEEARDALHRDAAPAQAAQRCLAALQDDLNRRLGHLAASFRVAVGADGALAAHFADGTRTSRVPVGRLSGGERVVFALAWRIALQDRYATRVGVLCLDEPTLGLDARRVDALALALEAWRPHGSGRQFLVVTHDRRLLRVFDRVVDLGQKS